jgi:hypothetical protein
MLAFQWRITKYDPELRDEGGKFQGSSWSSVWNIGKLDNGAVLTVDEYLHFESAYVNTAISFAIESGAFELAIKEFEGAVPDQSALTELGLPAIHPLPELSEGSVVGAHQAGDIIRLVLRELVWLKLVASSFFVHFGHDFYMYVGSDVRCDDSRRRAEASNLFVEEFDSPYS